MDKFMVDFSNETRICAALNWAIEAANDPTWAAANWLVRDICSKYNTAMNLLNDPEVSIEHLRSAKSAFKTMRVVGETTADRRLAARLYAGAIAVALVRHSTRISSQSERATRKALLALEADMEMPDMIRDMAGLAISTLGQKHLFSNDTNVPDQLRQT